MAPASPSIDTILTSMKTPPSPGPPGLQLPHHPTAPSSPGINHPQSLAQSPQQLKPKNSVYVPPHKKRSFTSCNTSSKSTRKY